MNTIRYITGSGKIYATDVQIEDEINCVLNLNNDIIKRNRANVVLEIIQKLGKNWTKSDIQNELKDWQSRNKQAQLRPYYGVSIAYLSKKLKTISTK